MNYHAPKKAIFTLFITLFITLFAPLAGALTMQAENLPPAAQLLNQVSAASSYKSAIYQINQLVIKTDNSERKMQILTYAINNGQKKLTLYQSPARIKGSKILSMNDGMDFWYFSAKTKRTRRIASHARKQRVMGSHFSYEDLQSGDYNLYYQGKTVRKEKIEGRDCYVLDLVPTPKGPSYKRVLLWVGVADDQIHRADYYDQSGTIFKRFMAADFRPKKNGKLEPWQFTMQSLEGDGKTVNTFLKKDLNATFSDTIFNSKKLDRPIAN